MLVSIWVSPTKGVFAPIEKPCSKVKFRLLNLLQQLSTVQKEGTMKNQDIELLTDSMDSIEAFYDRLAATYSASYGSLYTYDDQDIDTETP